ncbi:MAG TPA: hypothetical protein DCZ01_02170 [Elusimicrobia bacterium]|nr:MAG: hypothetical protein A2040_13000 [Rhodocyclales bacterium GWA2_65_19]HAZ07336.1 hypothetical protein [Elusimicrobiota bacterium]
MGAREPRVGVEYATASGLPVRVVAINGGQIELQSLASDSCFYVPAGYPLGPMTGPNLAVARKLYPHQARGPAAGAPVRMGKPLAPIIDAMLLAGGHTMRGIVREVRRKASASCRGKDLRANVRARMYWFRRRGYMIDTNAQGRFSATPPHSLP